MSNRDQIIALQQSLQTQIIGQPKLVDALLIALLADGHLLVEGGCNRQWNLSRTKWRVCVSKRATI